MPTYSAYNFMSRPKPHTPVNLKTSSIVAQQLGPKYKKVSFSNAGHAHNLAEKLNKLYNCNDFSVYKLTTGQKISDGHKV